MAAAIPLAAEALEVAPGLELSIKCLCQKLNHLLADDEDWELTLSLPLSLFVPPASPLPLEPTGVPPWVASTDAGVPVELDLGADDDIDVKVLEPLVTLSPLAWLIWALDNAHRQ